MSDRPKSVSIWHPYLKRKFLQDGKEWEVVRVQMLGTATWAYIRNTQNKDDQARISLTVLDELD